MDSTSPNAVVVSRPDYDGTLTQAAREDYTFFTHLSTLLPTNLSTPCHSSPSTPARRPPAHLEAHPAPYSTEYLSSSIPVISTWLPSPASLGRNFCPSQPFLPQNFPLGALYTRTPPHTSTKPPRGLSDCVRLRMYVRISERSDAGS